MKAKTAPPLRLCAVQGLYSACQELRRQAGRQAETQTAGRDKQPSTVTTKCTVTDSEREDSVPSDNVTGDQSVIPCGL